MHFIHGLEEVFTLMMIYFTYEQILNISSLQLITLGIDLGITTIDILAG